MEVVVAYFNVALRYLKSFIICAAFCILRWGLQQARDGSKIHRRIWFETWKEKSQTNRIGEHRLDAAGCFADGRETARDTTAVPDTVQASEE